MRTCISMCYNQIKRCTKSVWTHVLRQKVSAQLHSALSHITQVSAKHVIRMLSGLVLFQFFLCLFFPQVDVRSCFSEPKHRYRRDSSLTVHSALRCLLCCAQHHFKCLMEESREKKNKWKIEGVHRATHTHSGINSISPVSTTHVVHNISFTSAHFARRTSEWIISIMLMLNCSMCRPQSTCTFMPCMWRCVR